MRTGQGREGTPELRIYEPRQVRQCRRVLFELALVLRPFRGKVILIGGWAANLLVRECAEADYRRSHLGSTDIDLLLAVPALTPGDCLQIRQVLLDNGYASLEGTSRRFSFSRALDSSGESCIYIDLMVPTARPSSRDRVVERGGLWCILVRGGQLAAQHHRPVRLRGKLPNGRAGSATVHVADFPALLTLKGLALGERLARGPTDKYEKHAYDISCVLYACGPTRVAGEVRHALSALNPDDRAELDTALRYILASFSHLDAGGPEAAATVRAQGDPAGLPRYRNDAFFAVAEFLEALGYPVNR